MNWPYPFKTILLFVGFLLSGFVLGFVTKTIINPQKTYPSVAIKPSFDESKLPISLSLLTNPIVYEWSGSVKGKLTQKDEHSFTLVDDQGNRITITDILSTGDKWKMMFFDKANKNKEASFSAIPIGSNLMGDFFILKNGPNTPIGSMFVKQ